MNGETYLGDGVYASFDGYQLKLWTDRESGRHVIYLDPAVYDSLTAYAHRAWSEERAPVDNHD